MRKRLALLALAWLLFALPVRAQDVAHFAAVEIEIWPEFDRPAVLVIYHITLGADTALPATITVKVPAQAEVNAVAVADEQGWLFDTVYERSVMGKWATLSIAATAPVIQVEYYDVLVKNGNTRTILFEWPGGVAVDAFRVKFQNPTGATDLRTEPQVVETQIVRFDLERHITAAVSLEAGDTFRFTAQYEKPNDSLSISNIPVEPAFPLEQMGGQVSWSDVLPWLIGGLGLGLIALGLTVLYGFIKGGKLPRAKGATRKRPVGRASDSEARAEKGRVIYCHACGHRAQPGDAFCRTCGARLRREE